YRGFSWRANRRQKRNEKPMMTGIKGAVKVGEPNQSKPLCLFLCGDVMTGRGIDQVLPHPGDPVLYESWVHDAREYVKLAERINGPITQPVSFKYIWGDALAELHQA